MTQTDRFLQFLRARAEREIRETEVLVRIESDVLVITNRCPIAERESFRAERDAPAVQERP